MFHPRKIVGGRAEGAGAAAGQLRTFPTRETPPQGRSHRPSCCRRGAGAIEAPLTFVGFRREQEEYTWNSFKGLDLRDRIVVLL